MIKLSHRYPITPEEKRQEHLVRATLVLITDPDLLKALQDAVNKFVEEHCQCMAVEQMGCDCHAIFDIPLFVNDKDFLSIHEQRGY
tara:strand:+ start:22 stop:279 length:258 start_codon:yes stop_codon:yes gene_type:complete